MVYIKRNNSLRHEREKFGIAWRHVKAGCDIITEVEAKDNEIVDVVCLDCNEEIKIVEAKETPEEYEKNGRRIISL